MRPLGLPEAQERADRAELVRRVVLPGLAPVGAGLCAQLGISPVALEGAAKQHGWQHVLRLRRVQGHGAGRGIDIAAIRCPGQARQLELCRRGDGGGDQLALEFIPPGRPPGGLFRLASGGRQDHCIFVAAQRPEVVPQRVGRLVRIALVADRRRHQAEQMGALRRLVDGRALALPQAFHPGRDALHLRPMAQQEGTVLRVPPDLGDGIEILAMAVVLDHRVGAPLIDATGHLARGKDVAGIPIDKLARGGHLAQPQQARNHHCAVAHPGARIGAGARPQRRAVARHQDMSQRTAQGIDDRLCGRRQADLQVVQALAPLNGSGVETGIEAGIRAGFGAGIGAARVRLCIAAQRRDKADHF